MKTTHVLIGVLAAAICSALSFPSFYILTQFVFEEWIQFGCIAVGFGVGLVYGSVIAIGSLTMERVFRYEGWGFLTFILTAVAVYAITAISMKGAFIANSLPIEVLVVGIVSLLLGTLLFVLHTERKAGVFFAAASATTAVLVHVASVGFGYKPTIDMTNTAIVVFLALTAGSCQHFAMQWARN